MIELMDTQALYLVGISPNHAIDFATKYETKSYGITRVDVGSSTAWVRPIDRSEFEGPDGERNLADLQWLTPRVMAHDAAVHRISTAFTNVFYPSRFGTLFSSESVLRSLLVHNAPVLADFFASMAGKREWGIRLHADRLVAGRLVAAAQQPTGSLAAAGLNYLRQKQFERDLAYRSEDFIQLGIEAASSYLQNQLSQIVRRPLVASAPTDACPVVASFSVLCDHAAEARLNDLINDWNQQQFTVTAIQAALMGPWPAYSFCPSLSTPTAEPIAA